ncbi:MAG: NUDIX domain-containing protein [Patescibacteria group bacterium]
MQKVIPHDSILVPDVATKVFEGEIFDVYHWPQTLFDDTSHTFEMLKRTDTVTVMCVVDDKILVINDEQPHLGMRKTFPGGRVDPEDASIEMAAKREVLEETGYSFKNWRLILVQQPYKKIEWFVYMLLAWDEESKTEPKLDAGERISVESLTIDELKKVVNGRFVNLGDSMAIIESLESLEQLLALPEFDGQTVDR